MIRQLNRDSEAQVVDAFLRDVWKGALNNAVRAGTPMTQAVFDADVAVAEAIRHFCGNSGPIPGMSLDTVIRFGWFIAGCRAALCGGGSLKGATVLEANDPHEKNPRSYVRAKWDVPDGEEEDWVDAVTMVWTGPARTN